MANKSAYLVLAIFLVFLVIFGCATYDKCDFNKDGNVDVLEKERCGGAKCGDGVCQDNEKQTCPDDCEIAVIEPKYDECDFNKDGTVDSVEERRCEGEYDECDFNRDGKVDSVEQNRCGASECGDGICQDLEKQNNLCPEDCEAGDIVSTGIAEITVDFSSNKGILSDYLFGTIAGPAYDANSYPLLEEANFKLVEVSVNIPIPSDPRDIDSYDFSELDNQMDAVLNIDAMPLVWFNQNEPVDLDDYEIYVTTIVEHVKDISSKIEIFRFGNEPDSGHFWKGTDEEYFETYGAFANAVKSIDPNFILVGPSVQTACKGGWSKCDGTSSTASDFVVDFLDYLKENDVELDYFTFHGYSAVPYPQFYLEPLTVKDLLQDYPVSGLYGVPRLGNDEWNIMVGELWSGAYHNSFDTAWTAVSNINNLINMVNGGVMMSIRYGGTSNEVGTDFPLTDGNYEGKPAYYAFKGFNMLEDHYLLESEGGDNFNLGVISGKTDDEIIIIISNFDIEGYVNNYDPMMEREYDPFASQVNTYDSYSITIDNLDWTGDLEFEKYVVDNTRKLELVDDYTIEGSGTIAIEDEISIPAMHVLVIKKP